MNALLPGKEAPLGPEPTGCQDLIFSRNRKEGELLLGLTLTKQSGLLFSSACGKGLHGQGLSSLMVVDISLCQVGHEIHLGGIHTHG